MTPWVELRNNPHMHVLMLDGVYVDGEDAPVFVPAPPRAPPQPQFEYTA